MRTQRRGGGGMLPGFLLAFVFLGVAGYVYLRYGHPPVATADTPFPNEVKIVHMPLDARIDRELQVSPLAATPENVIAGAHVYVAHCAVCHGTPGLDSSFGKYEYPAAPQLWHKHADGVVVGVSDDPAGVSYWKVKNGIRLTGMPSYQHMLSEPEMWQVALLVAQADKVQPAEVNDIFVRANALRTLSESKTEPGPIAAQ